MILLNSYNYLHIWIRYYFQKYSPEIFYPYILKYFYQRYLKRPLHLKSPERLSEKINYLKLYDNYNIKLKKILSDKLTAKNYVKIKIPDLNVANVYSTASSFEELDFSLCPESFIIKTNHACKSHIFIPNKNTIAKSDWIKYKKYYKKVLNINYAFWGTLELQYKDIKPEIYAEEFLQNSNDKYLMTEYEVYCINGEPEFIQFVGQYNNYRDISYIKPNFEKSDFSLFPKQEIFFPPYYENREKIIEYSRILSKDFRFARVDFFEVNKKLYFGEVTFTPFSGDLVFLPDEYDKIIGKKLII